MTTTATDRRQDIGRVISDAMRKLSDIDWTRESESITAAQADLDESMSLYVENKASRVEGDSCQRCRLPRELA